MMKNKGLLSRLLSIVAGVVVLLSFVGCSTVDRSPAPKIDPNASWVVLPFANHTETPLAGQRAEAIALALLQASGNRQVKLHASEAASFFEPAAQSRQEEALTRARESGAQYALAGAVDEWRYKVGVDGEPVVGLSLQIIEVSNGKTLWSGSGGKSGWSREALSSIARQLLRQLLLPAVSVAP